MPSNRTARYLKSLSQEDWLGAFIEANSPDISEHWNEPRVEVHPSASGTKCVRSLQLGMLGHRTVENGSSTRRMLNGTWTHRRWNEFFESSGLLLAKELRIESVLTYEGTEFQWSGEIDLVLAHPETKNGVVVEIKSMGSSRFRRLPPQLPSPVDTAVRFYQSERRYAIQLCQYWTVLTSLGAYGVVDKRAAFLFENTDTQEVAVRWVEFTDEMVDEAFKVAVLGYDKLRSGILLDPPFKRASVNCKGCARRSLCFALQDGEPEVTEVVAERLRSVRVG